MSFISVLHACVKNNNKNKYLTCLSCKFYNDCKIDDITKCDIHQKMVKRWNTIGISDDEMLRAYDRIIK